MIELYSCKMQDLANLMSAAERKRIFFALQVLNKVVDN